MDQMMSFLKFDAELFLEGCLIFCVAKEGRLEASCPLGPSELDVRKRWL